MIIGTAQIKLYAPWVFSLKEKRMIVKSIIAKTKNKFNISIVLGLACVTESVAQADSIVDTVIGFIEANTEAEILDIQREIR